MKIWLIYNTVATDEVLCLKNAGTHTLIFLTSKEQLALMAIEKFKILGAIVEVSAKQLCQFSPLGLFSR